MSRTCDVIGCSGKHYARGMCARHYRRWLEAGKPDLSVFLRTGRIQKHCARCGNLIPIGSSRKYCSDDCSRAAVRAQRAAKKPVKQLRVCSECSNTLPVGSPANALVCSEDCRKARRARLRKLCVIPGCEKPARTRALCSMHYERWRSSPEPRPVISTWGGEKPALSEDEVARAQTQAALARIRERDPFLAAQFQHELNKHRRRNNLPEVRL